MRESTRLAIFLFCFLVLPLFAAWAKARIEQSPWHWSYGSELAGMGDYFQEVRCVYPLGVQFCGWR